ncbi:hypothetical protein LguiB_031157 [Lonicera macranthoides]
MFSTAWRSHLRNLNSLALFSNIELTPHRDEKNEGDHKIDKHTLKKRRCVFTCLCPSIFFNLCHPFKHPPNLVL